MYKVFVNEKRLSFSKSPQLSDRQIRYENSATLEIAVDLLENTSCQSLSIYGENLEEFWKEFCLMFRLVEAAGGVVRNSSDQLLFIRRLGKWDLPKGKIEKDESREDAAVREIAEETGLDDLTLEDFINTTYHVYTERNGDKILKTTHWFKIRYNGSAEPKPQTEEGISEVAWKNESQIEADVLPMTFQNIKLILNDYRTIC